MSKVSIKCFLYSLNTLTSHDSTNGRSRPTLKHSEQNFRTGPMIYESKDTFGYSNKSYQKSYTKSYIKSYTKSDKTCDMNTNIMLNFTHIVSPILNSVWSSWNLGKKYVLKVFKNLNHKISVCKFVLCTDIETNRGPVSIDSSKTISAPYTQGNEMIFGETAGKQCLAMCLCALIYKKRQNICSAQDLVQIMNIGNELYSNLSCLTRQSFLMFTELPSELTVFDTNYHIDYSESYNGKVIGNSLIEGYQFCAPFHRAFELLLLENYDSFILTIDCNAVCIYSTDDGKYKIFDSHSRDINGHCHPQGTCVLLEATNINNVIWYFQSLYNENNQYELIAVNVEEIETTVDQNLLVSNNLRNNDHVSNEHMQESKTTEISSLCKQCPFISLYSICYSIIKPCSYWNSNTVAAVVYFGITLYNNAEINSSKDLPQNVEIFGTAIKIQLHANYQGIINDTLESKVSIENVVCHSNESTGFLIWLGGHCISCIFHATSKKKTYSILAYDCGNSSPTSHYIKNIKDKHSLVETIFKLANINLKQKIVNYEIQFLSCFAELSETDRKKLMRKHAEIYNTETIASYQKKHINSQTALEQEQKQKLLAHKRATYQTLDSTKKVELLAKNMNYHRTMTEEKKQKLLENRRAKYTLTKIFYRILH